jgi:hypothetical protein
MTHAHSHGAHPLSSNDCHAARKLGHKVARPDRVETTKVIKNTALTHQNSENFDSFFLPFGPIQGSGMTHQNGLGFGTHLANRSTNSCGALTFSSVLPYAF